MTEDKPASVAQSFSVCINYTDFLSASCKKRWRFIDAIYGVMPFFGMVTKKSATLSCATPERLKDLALQIISTQVSDEVNIVRLIALAQEQQIDRFQILLPYPLAESQLAAVRRECVRPLELKQLEERLYITLLPRAH